MRQIPAFRWSELGLWETSLQSYAIEREIDKIRLEIDLAPLDKRGPSMQRANLGRKRQHHAIPDRFCGPLCHARHERNTTDRTVNNDALNSNASDDCNYEQVDLLILDDTFPDPISGFRVAEYNFYFDSFDRVKVACTSPHFLTDVSKYADLYPENLNKMLFLDGRVEFNPAICYMNFLNNAASYLSIIEQLRAPFVFTLYPGGGFAPGEKHSDEKMRRVLSSKLLRAVISTQSITTSYLEKFGCIVPIHEIYGAAINPLYTTHSIEARSPRGGADASINICFAAYNYGDNGRTKGYPEFIAAAERLATEFPAATFSVVGNFGPADIALSANLTPRLSFVGTLATPLLKKFFLQQDLLISPNHPRSVTQGAFDGFPTATCVEASLCGVAIVCADELGLNTRYEADEILICPADADQVVAVVRPLLAQPQMIAALGERGCRKSMSLFGTEAQLTPRTRIIRDVAAREGRII